jgi:Zn-dependent protease with chaperone function
MKTDLAAVMGHEIAHAVARHSLERASAALAVNVGSISSRYCIRWSNF